MNLSTRFGPAAGTLAAMLLALFAGSCSGVADRGLSASVMADVNPFGWLNEAVVTFDNRDTLATYDLSLVLRCGTEAAAGALPLTMEFEAPDSSRFVERHTFPVVLPAKPASTAVTVTIPYRQAVRFGLQGTYRATIKPSAAVRGIEAAGFTFQKNEQTWEKTN